MTIILDAPIPTPSRGLPRVAPFVDERDAVDRRRLHASWCSPKAHPRESVGCASAETTTRLAGGTLTAGLVDAGPGTNTEILAAFGGLGEALITLSPADADALAAALTALASRARGGAR